MKVAALQMVSSTALQTNLEQALVLLRQAAAQGAELALLPEYFCLLGRRDTDKLSIQEPYGDGPIQRFLASSARELGLWIVGGSLPLTLAQDGLPAADCGSRVYNSTLVYSPQGECICRYDKIHLFRFDNGRERYDESAVLRAGSQPARFELPSRDGQRWQIGLSICYDLRFAELYRAYAAQGADLLLVPSAFTYTTGQAHWELLLRTRAVENLCFVAAAGQGGMHDNGRRTWGQSLVVDPWGAVLAQHPQEPGVVMAAMDAVRLAAIRSQLPALQHRVL